MTSRIEHVNLTVHDCQRTAQKLCALFDWKVRWHGPSMNSGYSYHVGNEEQYVALYSTGQDTNESSNRSSEKGPLNHVGVVVDDFEAVKKRVIAAGYRPYSESGYEPGRRFYFIDDDQIEYEVVSYAA